MARIQEVCCGDCDSCHLRIEGKVDMIPCVLDQIFRKMQDCERRMSKIDEAVSGMRKEIQLAGIDKEEVNDENV